MDHFSFNSMLLNSKCHRVWEFHNWAWWRWRDGDYTTTWQFIEQHLNIFKRLWQYQLFLELSVHESFNIVFSSSRSITFVCVFVVLIRSSPKKWHYTWQTIQSFRYTKKLSFILNLHNTKRKIEWSDMILFYLSAHKGID